MHLDLCELRGVSPGGVSAAIYLRVEAPTRRTILQSRYPRNTADLRDHHLLLEQRQPAYRRRIRRLGQAESASVLPAGTSPATPLPLWHGCTISHNS